MTTSDNIFGVLLCSRQTDYQGIVADIRAAFPSYDEALIQSFLAKFSREGLVRILYADNAPVEIAVLPEARAVFQEKIDAQAYKNLMDAIKISLGLSLGAFVAVIETIAMQASLR